MPAKTNPIKKPKKPRATPSKPGTIGHPIKKAPKVSQKQKQNQTVTVNVNAAAPRSRPRPRQSRTSAPGSKPTPSISNYNFPNPSQPYYHNSPWSSLDNGSRFGSGQSQQQQTAFMNMFTGQMQQILNPFMEQMRQTQAQPPAQAPFEQQNAPAEQQQAPSEQQEPPAYEPMDVDAEPEPTEADYFSPVGNENETGAGVRIKTEPISEPMEFEEATSAPVPENVNQRATERGGVKTTLSDDLGSIIISAKDAKERSRLGRIAQRLGLESLNNGDTLSLDGWVMEPNDAGSEVYYNNSGLRWNKKSKKLSIDPKSSDARTAPIAESAPIQNNRPALVAPASKRSRS